MERQTSIQHAIPYRARTWMCVCVAAPSARIFYNNERQAREEEKTTDNLDGFSYAFVLDRMTQINTLLPTNAVLASAISFSLSP